MTTDYITSNQELFSDQLAAVDIDASVGTSTRDLLVTPAAQIFATLNATYDTIITQMSLAEADDANATKILGNVGLVAGEPGQGSGTVTLITLPDVVEAVVRATDSVSCAGYSLRFVQDVIATSQFTDALSSLYVPMFPYDDEGRYYFTVDAYTVESMPTPILVGAAVSTDSYNIESAKAGSTFSATPAKTLTELKSMYADGLSAKILSGPAQISALLKSESALNILDLFVVGAGDAALTRSVHPVLGTLSTGYVDINLRTAALPSFVHVIKTGTRLEDGRYLVLIDSSDLPGFTCVYSVSASSGTTRLMGNEFEYEFSYDEGYADRFCAGQRASVTFTYPNLTEASVSFDVELVGFPNIASAQAFLDAPDIKSPVASILARGACPLFTSVSVRIFVPRDTAFPSEADVQTVISNALNLVPMGSEFLPGTVVTTAVAANFPGLQASLPVVMDFLFSGADGTLQHVYTKDTLVFPEQPADGATSRSFAVCCAPEDVAITFERLTR